MENSALVNKIMERANALVAQHGSAGLSRGYIIAAAIETCKNPEEGLVSDELNTLSKLVDGFISRVGDTDALLDAWRNKAQGMERTLLALQLNKAHKIAEGKNLPTLTADIFISVLVDSIAPPSSAPTPKAPSPAARKAEEKPAAPSVETPPAPQDMPQLVHETNELKRRLRSAVLGQETAVNTFATGYFNAQLQSMTGLSGKGPLATFLFAGPPGVGKTFLSETAAHALNLPFRRFDMSEYSDPNASFEELTGFDSNYRSPGEGLLTGFVRANPRCVVLFDEIEKACLRVIHMFLQILDGGRLRDSYTEEEVSFKDAMLIFTTNAGRSLYEDAVEKKLSSMPRDVVLDALKNDVNPASGIPYFPAAICSRFSAGCVVMFDHLPAHILRQIARRQLISRFEALKTTLGISYSIDEDAVTSILLKEGAAADARGVKTSADAFFSGELYELYRLVASDRVKGDPGAIRAIRVSVDLTGSTEEVVRLLSPRETPHIALYSEGEHDIEADGFVVHKVTDEDQMAALMRRESIQMALIALFRPGTTRGDYLNREDAPSAGQDMMNSLLKKHPSLPVLLLEEESDPFTDEEKESYYKRGVRGFVADRGDRAALIAEITRCISEIFQQNAFRELARANRRVSYETAQSLEENGSHARITLYNLKLETAIRAKDAGDVMSMLSKPSDRFDDVIGAQDAKDELRVFISYLKNPRKYYSRGAMPPKGILLYGPPGTGKTMLARAFAAEADATFIATEGNQFFTGYVGQGAAMVHRLFSTARRYAPAVIFVDEIDAIARRRTGRDTDMAQDSEQILTAFFAEMDGFAVDPARPVFVLGATNYSVDQGEAMALDPAMLRRFDRRILMKLPLLEDRKLFLRKKIAGYEHFRISDGMIDSLAARSTGMSLAQLTSIIDLAMRASFRNDTEYVDDAMLEEAYGLFNDGEEKRYSPESTLRTARHEAGHALISYLSGEKPAYVTVVSRGDYGGYMQVAGDEDKVVYTRRDLLNRIRAALGGRAAELVCYGDEDGLTTGASGDLKSATHLAQRILCAFGMNPEFGMAVTDGRDPELNLRVRQAVNHLLDDQLEEAKRQIEAHRDALDRLTDALISRNSLNESEISGILGDLKA